MIESFKMNRTNIINNKTIFDRIKSYRLPYLLIFSLIFISDDTYLFGTSGIPGMETIKFCFIFLTTAIVIIKFNLKWKQTWILIAFLCLFYLSSLINGSGISGGPLLLCCIIACAFALSNGIPLSTFAYAFSDIIYLINVYSLIIWLLAILGIIPLHASENIAGSPILESFGCIFFDYKIALRNSSFFREPGMYMVFINFAFILESLLLRKNVKKIRLVIYCISIFSTFSTAGYIIFGGIYLISILNVRTFSWKKLLPTSAIVLGVIILMSTDYSVVVFGKLEEGERSASYLGRVSSITVPLEMISNNPIFGCGIADFSDSYRNIAMKQYGLDIKPEGMATNTILNAASVFGIWFGLYLMWGFWKFTKKLRLSKLLRAAVYLCILMALSNEVIMYSTFTYWFISYGFSKWKA